MQSGNVTDCAHPKCVPVFDKDAALRAPAGEVRKRWPRWQGPCPDCGVHLIRYASLEHYIYGDY